MYRTLYAVGFVARYIRRSVSDDPWDTALRETVAALLSRRCRVSTDCSSVPHTQYLVYWKEARLHKILRSDFGGDLPTKKLYSYVRAAVLRLAQPVSAALVDFVSPLLPDARCRTPIISDGVVISEDPSGSSALWITLIDVFRSRGPVAALLDERLAAVGTGGLLV